MRNPYRARVDERHFLNLPGFHGGAYVQAYVEDTGERELVELPYGDGRANPHPRIVLEIADCQDRINLDFEVDTAMRRMNSFHKVDTLIAALVAFRDGLAEECVLYRARARAMDEAAEPPDAAGDSEAGDEDEAPPRDTRAVRRARRIRTAQARFIASRAHPR